MIVNELSNTIDLESTLIRAEALFKRYQRLVEAVDKKQNFPAPRVQSPSSASTGDAPSTSKDNNNKNAPDNKGKEPEQEKIITPELRKLLSREVEVLPRKTVAQKGDGMPKK